MNTKLLQRLEDRLKEFVSTEELPYGGGLSGEGYDKPRYPSLYLSRSTDPGLMKLPGEGSAMVRYKVKRREIDESRDDGQPLYGASIEIQSLEPCAEEEEETGLESTVFLKEFAVKPRAVTKLMKTSKLNPLMIHKSGVLDEFRVRPKKLGWNRDERLAGKSPMSYYTNDIKDARNTAADLLKRKRAGQNVGFEEREFGSAGMMRLARVGKTRKEWPLEIRHKIGMGKFKEGRAWDKINKSAVSTRMQGVYGFEAKEFAEARDRDGEGRFAAGGVPGPQDYAIAGAVAKKKKMAVGAGLGVGALAGGAMLARNARSRMVK
jgi:hypothetical protein